MQSIGMITALKIDKFIKLYAVYIIYFSAKIVVLHFIKCTIMLILSEVKDYNNDQLIPRIVCGFVVFVDKGSFKID